MFIYGATQAILTLSNIRKKMFKITKNKLAVSFLSILLAMFVLSNLSLGADHASQKVRSETSLEKTALYRLH